jgi:hypothetical protein
MEFYDIFNGDADGLCALHQLRLADPRAATLITGVKRDIALLARVTPEPGDELTVLDISLDTNREALLGALQIGARVRYFDHHFAGEIPRHRLLETHIDPSATVCTSLIVDRHLEGRFRAWALVAAFGDNLLSQAYSAAAALGLGRTDIETLRELGECLNYNAYGEFIEDLHFHPAVLYRRLHGCADPLEFARHAPEFRALQRAYAEDLERALRTPLEMVGKACAAVFLPDEKWSRRVNGAFANELARRDPQRAHAVLTHRDGGYSVSLRAPQSVTPGIHQVARLFPGGNGRATAAGIQFLPEGEVDPLFRALREAYDVTAAL